MDQGCGAVQMPQPRRLGPEHDKALLALSRCGPQSLQRDEHISKHVLLSQELYCLVTRDLHPEMPQSCKVKAVDCNSIYNKHQIASNSIKSIAYSNCSSVIKTIRIPESRFLTRYLDPKICHATTTSKKVPSLPHGAVGTCRLPWRSTAEARGRAGGPRRLRRGGAAAAPTPGGHGSACWAPSTAGRSKR